MSYKPGNVPGGIPQRVQLYLDEELQKIARAFEQIDNLNLNERAAEPSRYSDGMVVYADGTNWNPGSGEGFYGRENGAWVKL